MAPGRSARHRAKGRRAHGKARGRTLASEHGPQRHDRKGPLTDKNTLAGRAFRALGFSFTSNAVARLGTVGIGIMLARILGPHAFGTYAVAYVALIAVLSFNELGVSLAIVRWPGEPAEIAPTVTTISVINSIVLYAGCFFAAPVYAAAMGAPAATTVIRVLALNVVIDGIVSTPAALLQRQLRQGKIMVSDQINCWLGAGVTVFLAWSGFGAMSLAIGRMAGCLAGGVPLILYSPLPLRLGFNRAKARALLRFGLPLAGSSLIVFAVVNVDQLVVGRVLGATALGYYALASNLSGWPATMFSQPVRSVAPAVFSRLQHNRTAMVQGFLSVAGLLCAVALPVCALLSGSSVATIGFVYGARWLPAARALVWLGLLAGLKIFFELVYDYFVVLAKSRVVLVVQLVWLVALIPALIVGSRAHGVSGASMAGFVVAAAVVLPWYVIELRSVGIRLRSLAARLSLPLFGAATAGLAAYAIRRVVTTNLTALLASGIATMLVVGLLVYQMRGALRVLRPKAQDAAPLPTASDDSAEAARKTAEAIGVLIGMARAQQSFRRDPLDMTGPIPIHQEIRLQDGPASPLFRKTTNWDPSVARRPGVSGRRVVNSSADGRHHRQADPVDSQRRP
jgi:O-antigen/teichoic acid export membrane protein